MARSRSLRKGKVFKDFKDRREYRDPQRPEDFPDPPHYSIMPEDVKKSIKQDMNCLTRAEVDVLLKLNNKYFKEYNKKINI